MGLPLESFRYHTWATLRLFDHCAGLSQDQLNAPPPAGVWGPILPTLVHLVAAEGRYLGAMPGGTPGTLVREGMEVPLAELRAQFVLQARRWEELTAIADTLDVTLSGRGQEPDQPHAELLLLLQALHHGNDHRTHVCTILGANGWGVPEIDVWAYWDAREQPPTS